VHRRHQATRRDLGIIEDGNSNPMKVSLEKVKAELLKRVERQCETKLNVRNLFRATDEHTTFLVNC
jgi:hypothetical protein